jgi:hypothetical protein
MVSCFREMDQRYELKFMLRFDVSVEVEYEPQGSAEPPHGCRDHRRIIVRIEISTVSLRHGYSLKYPINHRNMPSNSQCQCGI